MKDMFRRDLKGFYKATHEKLYPYIGYYSALSRICLFKIASKEYRK